MSYIDSVIGQTIDNIQIIQKLPNTFDRAICKCLIHNVIFNSSATSIRNKKSGCKL